MHYHLFSHAYDVATSNLSYCNVMCCSRSQIYMIGTNARSQNQPKFWRLCESLFCNVSLPKWSSNNNISSGKMFVKLILLVGKDYKFMATLFKKILKPKGVFCATQ